MRLFLTFVSALLIAGNALAQSFPNRPVRVIVAFPPAGGADVVMRVLQPKFSELLGQPVIIENRPGAGGNIGTEAAARSPADGYTVLVASAAQAINNTLTKNLSWDLTKDFAPVVVMVENQSLLATHPSLPVSNVRELIALAKAKPGQISYASYGNGSLAHMSAELFKIMTGVDMLHVPYRGAGPAINDLVGGQVNVIFADVAAILPHVKSGIAKPLGIGSASRFAGLPEVPTIAEAGVPGFKTGGFLALVVPAGTPRPAVDALNAAMVKTLASPEVRERLEALASPPVGGTPEQLAQYLRFEIDKWARVVKAGNIKAE